MNEAQIKNLIEKHAEVIRKLHGRIHETVKYRNKNEDKNKEWISACTEFHKSYDQLAFIGGYEGALTRILSGDSATIEIAFCFIECRPYFFRSGYMYKDILRVLKKAPLSGVQPDRLLRIVTAYNIWRVAKSEVKK